MAATDFESILFEPGAADGDLAETPAYFGDLRLDQILKSLTGGRERYDLAPLFRRRLRSVEAVLYRQHVLRDLEQPPVLAAVRTFARGMQRMHECLDLMSKLHYQRQKQRWFLEAGRAYCRAVTEFSDQLSQLELTSRGLNSWRDYLTDYVGSPDLTSLLADVRDLLRDLDAVRYTVHTRGNRVTVSRYEGEPDMHPEIAETFAKFRADAVKEYRARFHEYPEMNHVEAQILDLVTAMHPDLFARVDDFCARRTRFVDRRVRRFDREIQLCLAYLEYIAPLKEMGLAFSYPHVSTESKHEQVHETFDLALAAKLSAERGTVVGNDLELTGPERIMVVSGPNNGGKTTFARTFGQLHHLAGLGLPVPGRDARLFLPDRIFTHFEREESIETLRGKFEDELLRIREILDDATADSVLIMNESFGSTTLRDAVMVGTEVARKIIALDGLCVFVTFVDELSTLSQTTVSMMSTVLPEDPAARTFKVVRKPADGLAHAAAIAEKYGLTSERLRRRLTR
jgi:DNA mismatch repair protein MutS